MNVFFDFAIIVVLKLSILDIYLNGEFIHIIDTTENTY